MTRLITILILLASILPPIHAKLNPESRLRLLAASSPLSRDDDAEPAKYSPLILQISTDSTRQQLTDLGVIIYHYRDDLLLTSIPKEYLDSVLRLDGVVNAATCGMLNQCLDMARPFAHVDAVQLGEHALPHSYDGSGVVTGFSDVGFDSKHIAFDGRVMAIYDYNTETAVVRSATTADEIAQWTTDTPDNYHATHVANIMAGGYKGNGYYGVAPGAEIVATTSRLHDVGILSGVEDIIAYARGVDKPAVINLSLSSFLGPHDGTDLLCQYLSRCAEDAVICISAGNTGHVTGFATQDLIEGPAKAVVFSLKGTKGYQVQGYTDIWGDTGSVFDFCIEVFDYDTQQTIYSSPWIGADELLTVTDETDPEWAKYMTGKVLAYGEVSPLNGRYNVTVMYDTKTEEPSASGLRSRYYTCLTMRQPEGHEGNIHVDMFADASLSYFNNNAGSKTRISADGCVNDMCTAKGVISVGMACSRNTAPLIPEGELKWNVPVGTIVNYSSYSDTPMIEPLPTVAAPGYYLVSAMSSEYIVTHPDIIKDLSAESTVDGKTYYWYAASGTSMSCPFVCGTIALWLQADPTLKAGDIWDIATSTALTDYPDIDNPRWGAGCIDALAGLEKVLEESGKIDAALPIGISVGTDRRLRIQGIDIGDIHVYDTTGSMVRPDAALYPGVYIIQTSVDSQTYKIVIR